jgi:hypothetical protein
MDMRCRSTQPIIRGQTSSKQAAQVLRHERQISRLDVRKTALFQITKAETVCA